MRKGACNLRGVLLLWVAWWFCFNHALAQEIGEWNIYPALQEVTHNEPAGNYIYSLCKGNLYSYNTSTSEIKVFNRLTGLYDVGISFIRYSVKAGQLVVVYENGNIDLIDDQQNVTNLQQIKNQNYSNLVINNVCISDNKALICTNFGLIELNITAQVFSNTYMLDENVQAATITPTHYVFSTSTGDYKGDKSLNLLDKNNWQKFKAWGENELVYDDNYIIAYAKNDGVFKIDPTTFTTQLIQKEKPTFFFHSSHKLLVGNAQKMWLYESLQLKETIAHELPITQASLKGNTIWASQGLNGLQAYMLDTGALKAQGYAIQPNSPVRDNFCDMTYAGSTLLVAGGYLNYTGDTRPGTVMTYDNEEWKNFQEEGIGTTTVPYVNTTCMVQDPVDAGHHFVGSSRQGLYEFRAGAFVKKYVHTNSPIDTIEIEGPHEPLNVIAVLALQYDSDYNLWMANCQVDSILVVKKNDGGWSKFYIPEIAEIQGATRIAFDPKGRLWMNSKFWRNPGIFCLDYNSTIDDKSDDQYRFINKSFINQDGVSYTLGAVNCLALDKDNRVWVGTSNGPFVIDDADDFLNNEDFRFNQIKINREDGSGLADYLLDGIAVSAIAVDAANRKWIGTDGNGIYLVSADGQEMLEHFTSNNSPLISDVIQSLAINPLTGVLMIGTFDGLMSYVPNATPTATSLEKDNVVAFPNPVKPTHTGPIYIKGLTLNSEVKITTITGQLVYQGTSNGGLFEWNGLSKSGKRVASGVYNVIASDASGNKAVVTRITVIN